MTNVSVIAQASGGNWNSRVAGSGVVWYHGFDSSAEVNQFRWVGGYGPDPGALSSDGKRVQWISSGGREGGGFMRVTYPLGANSGSMYWYRPFNPLTGASNGRGVDDPGAGNTIRPVSFTVTQGGFDTVYNWGLQPNPGWYMNPTHQASYPGKFQGYDFYLQVAVRRAQTPGAPPNSAQYSNITGKSVWFTTTNSTYTAQELVTYGQSAGNGDVVGVQSRLGIYSGQNFNPLCLGYQPNETTTVSNNNLNWRYSGGWDTLLYHVTPGTNGGTGADRNHVEVWAQHDLKMFPAESGQYTKIIDTKYSQSYDTSSNSIGAPGLPGWNALVLAIYHNGSQFATTSFQYDYDQVIFSKQTIAAPTN